MIRLCRNVCYCEKKAVAGDSPLKLAQQPRFLNVYDQKQTPWSSLVREIAERLQRDYGTGYSFPNLKFMRQFYLTYPELLEQRQIGYALRSQLMTSSENSSGPKSHAVRSLLGSDESKDNPGNLVCFTQICPVSIEWGEPLKLAQPNPGSLISMIKGIPHGV